MPWSLIDVGLDLPLTSHLLSLMFLQGPQASHLIDHLSLRAGRATHSGTWPKAEVEREVERERRREGDGGERRRGRRKSRISCRGPGVRTDQRLNTFLSPIYRVKKILRTLRRRRGMKEKKRKKRGEGVRFLSLSVHHSALHQRLSSLLVDSVALSHLKERGALGEEVSWVREKKKRKRLIGSLLNLILSLLLLFLLFITVLPPSPPPCLLPPFPSSTRG